jgi:hypothetical protein
MDRLGENGIDAPIVYSEHLTGAGQEMFDHAASWVGKELSPRMLKRRTGRIGTKPGLK